MPRDKRKSKAAPSNATAMRDILRLLDSSSAAIETKEQRTNWLEEQLLAHNSYPYPGTKKDVGTFHTAESLHEAVTYAVRDAKKDEFRSLKGQAAIARFFSVGKDMLKDEYLVGIGYQMADEARGVQLHDSFELERESPPVPAGKVDKGPPVSRMSVAKCGRGLRMESPLLDAGAEVWDALTPRETRPTPQLMFSRAVQTVASKPTLLESSTAHSPSAAIQDVVESPGEEERRVVYEPVRPTSSSRKRTHFQLEPRSDCDEPYATPDAGTHPAVNGNLDTTLPGNKNIRLDFVRLRELIAQLSSSLCPVDTPLHLKCWPHPALFRIYADIFGGPGWRHVFEDMVEGSGVRPSALLQAVIWAFLDLHIFQQPLPWPRLFVQSIVDGVMGATTSAAARWKHQLDTVLTEIGLEQLEDVVFLTSTIKPAARLRSEELHAVVSEHLADDAVCPFPGVLRDLSQRAVAALQRICEEALVLKGKMEAEECEYRMIQHTPGLSMYHAPPADVGERAHKRRKEVVALTVAPGVERTAHAAEQVASAAVVTLELAMVVSSQVVDQDQDQS